MFIFNLKINKNLFSKIFFTIMLLIIVSIFIFGVYVIFFKHNKSSDISSCVKADDVFEVTSDNYTNILKTANDDVDSYIGCKVHITGYVYRLLDFNQNQFVIARDMIISDDNQSLIVGFLCNYDKASEFEDDTWVDIVGEIKKGDFNGELAIVDIISIKKTEKPENCYVNPPDDTYIPTSNMF